MVKNTRKSLLIIAKHNTYQLRFFPSFVSLPNGVRPHN